MDFQYPEAKEDVSVLRFVKELFSDTPFINVVDEFPLEELDVPVISVVQGDTVETPYEVGNRSFRRVRQYKIDIFAANKVQRDDYSYRLANALKNKIVVYNYNEGFPPDVTPSILEYLDIASVRIIPIDVMPELVEKLYYRTTVRFVAINDRD